MIFNAHHENGTVEKNELNSELFEAIPDPIFYKDIEGTFLGCNRAFELILDATKGEIIGKTVFDVFPVETADEIHRKDFELYTNHRSIAYEMSLKDRDGTQRHLLVNKAVVPKADGTLAGMVGVIHDISELKRVEHGLKELSVIDELTGIANRRHFNTVLEKEWKRALRNKASISVLMIDIDFFKQYNDTYGHTAGDTCLRLVANLMRNTMKRGGDFVARYGGEEFVAILPDTDQKGAFQVAEKIRDAVADVRVFHGTSDCEKIVTISLGVATVVPFSTSECLNLINCADQALYRAKKNGRNRVEVY